MYHFTLKSRRRETNPNHKKEHEQIPGISISFLPQLLTKSPFVTLKPSDTHLLSLSWRSSFAASDSLECEITNTPLKTSTMHQVLLLLCTPSVVYVFVFTSLGSMGSNPERKSVAVLVLVSQNLSNFSPEWQHCYIPTNETSKKYLTHYIHRIICRHGQARSKCDDTQRPIYYLSLGDIHEGSTYLNISGSRYGKVQWDEHEQIH